MVLVIRRCVQSTTTFLAAMCLGMRQLAPPHTT